MQLKHVLCTFLLSLAGATAYGQDEAKTLYTDGIRQIEDGNPDSAVVLFGKTITLQPDNYYAWYNRGIAYSMMNRYEAALPDFNEVILLAPAYKKGWLNRGIARRRLTDYDGAILDYGKALQLDPAYPDAYYNRGLIYDLTGRKDLACADFRKALEYGLQRAKYKVDNCNDSSKGSGRINAILRLTRTATEKSYGFSEDNPVMAGTGPDGGPANQRAYLDLLRDAQGLPLKYQRKGSCCPYKTPNAILGDMALLDKYEIVYRDEDNKAQTRIVYISMYDYKEPKILKGFRTVQKP